MKYMSKSRQRSSASRIRDRRHSGTNAATTVRQKTTRQRQRQLWGGLGLVAILSRPRVATA